MSKEINIPVNDQMLSEIRQVLADTRQKVARTVNNEQLNAYWNIGQIIIKHEQNGEIRAEYGKKTLLELSQRLTKEFGKGFSRANLQNMRLLYLEYPICQSLSGKLNWSHYCELLYISDKDRRSFYEKECERSGWSVRELKRHTPRSFQTKKF